MSGTFVLHTSSGEGEATHSYSGADGERIHFTDGSWLEAKTAVRPPSVPESASLAENGVYVDCVREATDAFQCSLFLAADGRKLSSGVYKLESGSVSEAVKPKIGAVSEIYLQNGGILRLQRSNS